MAEEPLNAGAVPGFTPEQTWVLDVVAERAATAVVEKLKKDDCPFPCRRMVAVEAAVFGRAEEGVLGLAQRTISLEERARGRDAEPQLDWRTRVMWGVALALLTWLGLTFITIGKDLVEHHWLGF